MQTKCLNSLLIAVFVLTSIKMEGAGAQAPAEVPTGVVSSSPDASKISNQGVAEGPMSTERQSLLQMIKSVQSQGIGVDSYMQLFNAIEQKVRSGAKAEDVEPEITRLSKAVQEQASRLRAIKDQRVNYQKVNPAKKATVDGRTSHSGTSGRLPTSAAYDDTKRHAEATQAAQYDKMNDLGNSIGRMRADADARGKRNAPLLGETIPQWYKRTNGGRL